MNPTGALHIQLDWDGREMLGVDIISTRPRAAQWLSGLPVATALSRLPMLYSVCRHAQESAGQAALAAARGQFARIEPEAAYVILCEMTREHLWRLLLDWPHLLGLEALEQEFAHWYRRLSTSAESGAVADTKTQLADFGDFVATSVLGMPSSVWSDLDRPDEIKPGAALAGRLWHALQDDSAVGAEEVLWLPAVKASEFARICEGGWNEDFERHPHWQGVPAETGSLARWRAQPLIATLLAERGRGVRTRVLARLMDLAQCAGYIAAPDEWFAGSWLDAFSPSPGIGIACVETARGTLWHRLSLEDKAGQTLVAEYSVVAPTEWNFHPRGVFAAALPAGNPVDAETLRQQARRLILALDPCVPCRLEVKDRLIHA